MLKHCAVQWMAGFGEGRGRASESCVQSIRLCWKPSKEAKETVYKSIPRTTTVKMMARTNNLLENTLTASAAAPANVTSYHPSKGGDQISLKQTASVCTHQNGSHQIIELQVPATLLEKTKLACNLCMIKLLWVGQWTTTIIGRTCPK